MHGSPSDARERQPLYIAKVLLMSTYPLADIDRAARRRAGAAQDASPRALVRAVAPGSPADDAGFEPGCFVTSVDGWPVRDLIDWRWLASDDVMELGYIDLDGDEGVVEMCIRDRHTGSVTSGEGAPFPVKALAAGAGRGRSETAQATVYQKHRTLLSRKATYRV